MQDTIYYLIIVIYYFWYFYVKTVILGLGDLFLCFQVHLILFRSNLVLVMARYQLGVILKYIFLSVKFYRVFKQTPKSVHVFLNNYSINKIQIFVFLFSSEFQILCPCGFKEPSWIRGYFQKQTCFVYYFLEVDMFCFLTLLHPASN